MDLEKLLGGREEKAVGTKILVINVSTMLFLWRMCCEAQAEPCPVFLWALNCGCLQTFAERAAEQSSSLQARIKATQWLFLSTEAPFSPSRFLYFSLPACCWQEADNMEHPGRAGGVLRSPGSCARSKQVLAHKGHPVGPRRVQGMLSLGVSCCSNQGAQAQALT